MANSKSAEKRIRQNERNRSRNRAMRSSMRTAVKKLRATIEAGDREQALSLLPETLSIVARTAQKGGMHANVAARTTSRLTCAVQGLES